MRAKTLHLIYTLLKVAVYYIIILLAFGVLDTISVFKPIRCPILLPLTCNLGVWQFAVRAITSFLYTQVLKHSQRVVPYGHQILVLLCISHLLFGLEKCE